MRLEKLGERVEEDRKISSKQVKVNEMLFSRIKTTDERVSSIEEQMGLKQKGV